MAFWGRGLKETRMQGTGCGREWKGVEKKSLEVFGRQRKEDYDKKNMHTGLRRTWERWEGEENGKKYMEEWLKLSVGWGGSKGIGKRWEGEDR